EATVKTHLARAFTKLGVNSRTEAVSLARERGLLRE
ncbi:MAG TPA: LuxR C-terminal-related transcriptional regulator, partial [Actinomycetales bacterium]|nr:LuxR C-terminal-related transcriptional regulator [Actinomycetales bacterium]